MIKDFLLRRFAPRYLEDMPRLDVGGAWVACVIVIGTFRGDKEVQCKDAVGLIAAYKLARWMALMADWFGHYNPEYWGISYGVRRPVVSAGDKTFDLWA